ncbi:MAG TPA: hypothetical protein VHE78_06000 [Gemmatimonadaceae bacterium]|nr:hypothetical protein [Gemmatimonadaceae bacterium]
MTRRFTLRMVPRVRRSVWRLRALFVLLPMAAGSFACAGATLENYANGGVGFRVARTLQ